MDFPHRFSGDQNANLGEKSNSSIDNANAAAENARLAANNTYNEFLKIKTSYDKLSKDSIEIDEATNYYNNTIQLVYMVKKIKL